MNHIAENSIIYSVSDLNLAARKLLNDHFASIYVMGEISNLSRPGSGHLYFTLKDENAQVRCALFRFQHQRIPFTLENGQAVIVQGKVSLYEARGDFQLIATHIELAGEGKLRQAFEQLKKQLAKAGLFDEKYKQPIPTFPKQIGVISSLTAAALQDILKVLRRRCATIPIVIYPTQVQGEQAALQIVAAIKLANQQNTCDALILARGGGSLEDLWPFNEAIVAQAIFDSHIPVVTGIGHQTDFTIADFVADYRAPTPSAAAECVGPNHTDFLVQLAQHYRRLLQVMRAQIETAKTHLFHLSKRLVHPGERLQQQAQQLDQLEIQLHRAIQLALKEKKQALSFAMQTLDTLSPLNTLQRGYTITLQKSNQKLLTNSNSVKVGETIVTRLAKGELESIVKRTDKKVTG